MRMSRRRVLIAFIFMLALALGASAVWAATKTVTLHVKGMTCGGCATSVERALKSTDGVTDVQVSYEKGKAVIKYDDKKVTVARLREVIDSTGMSCDVDGAPGKGR